MVEALVTGLIADPVSPFFNRNAKWMKELTQFVMSSIRSLSVSSKRWLKCAFKALIIMPANPHNHDIEQNLFHRSRWSRQRSARLY